MDHGDLEEALRIPLLLPTSWKEAPWTTVWIDKGVKE